MPKKTISFTIEKSVLEDFDDYCQEHAHNRSALIEKLIAKFLQER